MSQTATFRAALTAIAIGDADTAHRINAELDEAGHRALFNYATAVLSICLEHRFKNDSSPEAVQLFVDEMRENFRNANPPIKPLMVEALIRAFAGEEHLIDEVPFPEQLNAQYPIIRKIVAESGELRDNFGQVLTQAESILAGIDASGSTHPQITSENCRTSRPSRDLQVQALNAFHPALDVLRRCTSE